MYKFILVLILCVIEIKGQSLPGEAWVTRARLIDPVGYFTNVIQEFVYEVERRGWHNLKLTDVHQNVDTLIANWHLQGTVLYTNGFVKSIQKIDVSTVTSSFSRTIENNVTVIPQANVNGRLHFRHMNIGYDVIADLNAGDGPTHQRYTGEILCNNVAFDFTISKNVITEDMMVSARINTIEGAHIRMIYRPENHVTQVLSRNFGSSANWNGISTWSTTFNSILEDVVKNKVQFPRYCFNNCT